VGRARRQAVEITPSRKDGGWRDKAILPLFSQQQFAIYGSVIRYTFPWLIWVGEIAKSAVVPYFPDGELEVCSSAKMLV